MADLSRLARNSVELQREMFRLAEHEHGLSIAVLAKTRDIPASTLKGWRDGTVMPTWAIGELRLPDDVTSLILTPYAKHVGTDETDDGDLDALAKEAAGYNVEYLDARSPSSERGPDLSPRERASLKGRSRRLASVARAAAA